LLVKKIERFPSFGIIKNTQTIKEEINGQAEIYSRGEVQDFGGSVVFLGLAKIILAITFGGSLLTIISLYPVSILGVLLVFAGWRWLSSAAI